MKEGDKVIWMYQTNGGWNYIIPVRAEVIKLNSKTVKIKAFKKDGSFTIKNVKRENLRV